jgi:hypothetical protein
MIQTIYIDKIEDLMPLISEQEYREDLRRYRSMYLYRGMPDTDYHMYTSLQRNCKHLQKELEPAILRNFTKYAAIDDPTVTESVWKQMILGQHHGLPTRLLDWSKSSLIALNFSVTEVDMDEMSAHDSMVWRIDMKELVDQLPVNYRRVLYSRQSCIFSVQQLAGVTNSLNQYDLDMGDHAMAIIEPPSIDQRIVNQYSFFSVTPLGMTDIEGFLEKHTKNTVRYVIRRHLRWQVRDMLDQLNVSERMVYPGLDGLSKWLGRHYYVKPEGEE